MEDKMVNLLQIYGRKKAVEIVLDATRELRRKTEIVEGPEILSPKAQLIKEQCISFGPVGNKLAKLFSIILEEDCTSKDTNMCFPFVRFACIIPIAEKNSHGYPHNIPVFMTLRYGDVEAPSSVKCLKSDGSLGSQLKPFANIITVASDDVAIKAVNKIFDGIEKETKDVLF
jgi:hypothetical protein